MMKSIFLACCGLALSATVQADSVVLWNQLGSQSDLQTSRVGPGGNYTGGGYFVPGVFGNAYAVDYPYNQDGSRLTFPVTVLPAAQGTIEFWGKLTNFPTDIAVSGVEFFTVDWPGTFPFVQYRLGFAANDGCGGGGMHGHVGVAVNAYCYGLVATATGNFGGGYSYPSILGDAAAWHHYALVWNQAGLPAPVPAGHRVAVFLDGVFESNYLQDRAPSAFGNPADYPNQVFGLILNRETQGTVAIDNLIIRDYAKLDFSDRFQENPLATSMTPFSTFKVTRLIIDQNRGTLFIWSNFTLGGDNNGIDPVKEEVTLKIANATLTIPAGSFHKNSHPSFFAFAGQVDNVWLEAFIRPSGRNHFRFQALAYGAPLGDTKNPVTMELMIGDDKGTTTANASLH